MASPKIEFRCPDELGAEIEARVSRTSSTNLVARRDLERYYATSAATLRTVELTEDEASLLCDALNGCWTLEVATPSQARTHLLMEVGDAMRLNSASKKWGVDSDKLLALLSGLTDAQAMAVLDAVERLWAGDETVQSAGLAT